MTTEQRASLLRDPHTVRPSEDEVILRARRYGCAWHGRLLSDACCECGMIKFYGGLLNEHPGDVGRDYENLNDWS